MAKTIEKMTKIEAVRRGLSDLGNDAKPIQLQGHITEKYGVDMSTDHISTYKGTIRKGKPAAKKPAAAKQSVNGSGAHVGGVNGSAKTQAAKPATSSLSEQVAMLKAVAGAIGKEEAKKIIDLL